MISKQRGIIDPWTLGFLISLTGLVVIQPWDKENNEISKSPLTDVATTVVFNDQTTAQTHLLNKF